MEFKIISEQDLKDKIAGGWAGKMIGVMYGDPTEFRARSEIYEKDLMWEPGRIRGALSQDDLYVQMSFMMIVKTCILRTDITKKLSLTI